MSAEDQVYSDTVLKLQLTLTRLERSSVVEVGRIPEQVLSTRDKAVSDQVVITGERAIHILSRHPEIESKLQELVETAIAPQEIHLNARDAQIAILYRGTRTGSLLCVTLWIADQIERMNSIHSARFAHEAELMRGRKHWRCVWVMD